MNLVKSNTLKMWILWKMRFWKCEFCQKCEFENVNFVKNENLKMWIFSKMRFWKCEFLDKMWIFAPACISHEFKPVVLYFFTSRRYLHFECTQAWSQLVWQEMEHRWTRLKCHHYYYHLKIVSCLIFEKKSLQNDG